MSSCRIIAALRKLARGFPLPRCRRVFGPLAVLLLIVPVSAGEPQETPLADAVQDQQWPDVLELIDSGVGLNAKQVDGMTAVHWAVYHDQADQVEILIEAGADVTIRNHYGVPPLSAACTNGNGKIVEMLLDAGADPNGTLPGGETALMTAARTGKLDAAQTLIQRGAQLDARERNGQTALMWAAAEGNLKVVDALIAAGADYRTPLDSGFTPLFFAVRQGHLGVVHRLLAAGLDVNEPMQPRKSSGKRPKPGTSPLILAVENGHFELALSLVDVGADPNDTRTGYAALHAITWVRKPIRGDGDPSPIGSGSISSLDFVRALVRRGADVNIRHRKQGSGNGRLNRTDATPFLLAAETADLPLMRLLVELGADPTLCNADHCTPLLAAAGVGVLSNGDEAAGSEDEVIEAIKYLLELGADINAVDDLGKSAMHGAAFKSWTKLVRFLADNGADVEVWNRENRRGWTPLLIAQGYRPGNFRPSPETVVAIEQVMRESGVQPTPPPPRQP